MAEVKVALAPIMVTNTTMLDGLIVPNEVMRVELHGADSETAGFEEPAQRSCRDLLSTPTLLRL